MRTPHVVRCAPLPEEAHEAAVERVNEDARAHAAARLLVQLSARNGDTLRVLCIVH